MAQTSAADKAACTRIVGIFGARCTPFKIIVTSGDLAKLALYMLYLDDDDDVGLHVLGCRFDILGTNCSLFGCLERVLI